MRADWTASGACSSGSTVHPRGAMRRAPEPPRRVRRALSQVVSRWRNRGTGGLTMHVFLASLQQVFLASRRYSSLQARRETIVWCGSVAAMGEMPMPGGWTMSMAWMRMPGQTWPGDAAAFLGISVVMMVAMMLPFLVPMLKCYRQAVCRTGEMRLSRLTALVGMGYFFVWTVFGMAAFPLGVALAAVEMQRPRLARAVPIAGRVVVLIAASLQLTSWKARHLPGGTRARPYAAGPLRHGLPTRPGDTGLRLGLHRRQCCAGL